MTTSEGLYAHRLTEFLETPVAVTGGCGFIGTNLISTLCRLGFRSVTALDIIPQDPGVVLPGVRYCTVDIMDTRSLVECLEESSVVIHLAGNAKAGRAEKDPHFDLEMNVGGTISIIDACQKVRARRLVFASSMAVHSTDATGELGEDLAAGPDTCYGISKLASELHVLRGWRRMSVPGVVLRYFKVYGRGHGGALSKMFKRVVNEGRVTIYGDGSQQLDYVHVEDVVQATILAAFCPDAVGQVLNIASGTSHTLQSIVDMMIDVSGRDDTVVSYQRLSGLGYEPTRYSAPIGAARRCLGYEPAWGLRDGLRSLLPSL